jgi:hypothetical protein
MPIMDDEYRLAWADIEGWTTNARCPTRPASKPLELRLAALKLITVVDCVATGRDF